MHYRVKAETVHTHQPWRMYRSCRSEWRIRWSRCTSHPAANIFLSTEFPPPPKKKSGYPLNFFANRIYFYPLRFLYDIPIIFLNLQSWALPIFFLSSQFCKPGWVLLNPDSTPQEKIVSEYEIIKCLNLKELA